MLHKTRGIVLHTSEYSESSIVAKILTEPFGLQSYIVNSVRSRKAKNKSSLFQPLTLVDLVVYHKPEKGLQRISEISASHPFHSIPYDIVKSSVAIFLAEVIYRCIKEEEPHRELFDFLAAAIKFMDMHEYNFSNYPDYMLIQMTRFLGSYPSGQFNEPNQIFNLEEGTFQHSIPSHPNYAEEETSQAIWTLMRAGLNSFHEIKFSQEVRTRVFNSLLIYYELHHTHGIKLKSQKILSEIFNS